MTFAPRRPSSAVFDVLDEIPRTYNPDTGRMEPINRGGVIDEIPRSIPNPFPRLKDQVGSDYSVPKMSPWIFLAQALGGLAGALGGNRGGNNQQQMPYAFGSDVMGQMQQMETNKLLRELLEISKGKRDDKSQYPEVKFPKKTFDLPDYLMPKTFGPGESLSVNNFGELIDL